MGRHNHVVNVRADGIAVVLGPLLRDARIVAATLVDVDSGMVLDAWSADGHGSAASNAAAPAGAVDLELLGAQHAEAARCALALLRSGLRPGGHQPVGAEGDTCEVVLGADGGCQHLIRIVPDPYGDRLALAVVVNGPARVLDRVRKRLRSVSVDALTAGPSMIRRPVRGGWSFAMPAPDVPASSASGPPMPRVTSPAVVLPPPPAPPVFAAPPPPPAPPVFAPPAPPPSVPSPPPVPALSGLDMRPGEPPAPRTTRPAPVVAVPARPVAVPAPAQRTDPAPLPHLRPVRVEPLPEAKGTGASQRASASEERTGPGSRPFSTQAEGTRAPSPPAALPAPAPSRPRPS